MRGKTAEDRRLLELLDPVAEAEGYAIVRLRLMGGERRRLQVMAERPETGDMGIDDCTRLSRALSAIFDAAEDLIKGEFVMEVSSPGIDRPLTRLADFTAYEGLEARLELDRMAEGRKRFKGVLAGVDGENVAIDLEGEDHTALIPFAWITDAKLVLSDEILKRGAEQRAARIASGGEAEEYDALDELPDGDEEPAANQDVANHDASRPDEGSRRPRVEPDAPAKGTKAKKKTKPKPKSNTRKPSIFSGD